MAFPVVALFRRYVFLKPFASLTGYRLNRDAPLLVRAVVFRQTVAKPGIHEAVNPAQVGDGVLVLIAFPNIGVKKLALGYARIEKV